MSLHHEKLPLQSKKFIAFLLAELGWKAVLIVALLMFKDQVQDAWPWWFMLSTVTIAGFVEVAFIGGQAALDKYVRVAQITSRGPTKEEPAEETPPTEETPS